MIIKCAYCGKKFTKQAVNQRYCSTKCQKRGYYYGVQPIAAEPQIKREKPKYKSELARLNAEARAHGMTYGKYVSKYGL